MLVYVFYESNNYPNWANELAESLDNISRSLCWNMKDVLITIRIGMSLLLKSMFVIVATLYCDLNGFQFN